MVKAFTGKKIYTKPIVRSRKLTKNDIKVVSKSSSGEQVHVSHKKAERRSDVQMDPMKQF